MDLSVLFQNGSTDDIMSAIQSMEGNSPRGSSIEIVGDMYISGKKVPDGYQIKADNPDMFIFSVRGYQRLLDTIDTYEKQLAGMDNIVKIMTEQTKAPVPASSEDDIYTMYQELQKKFSTLKYETDMERLRLEKEVERLTTKINNLKYRTAECNSVRTKNSRKFAAKVLRMAVEGMSVEAIHKQLGESMAKVPSVATIYRAVSTVESTDKMRILGIYQNNKDEFEGVSQEALIKWFEESRIRRLGLVPVDVLYAEYGKERVLKYIEERGFRPDGFVSGEYYRRGEINGIGRRRRKVEPVAPAESNEQVNDTW